MVGWVVVVIGGVNADESDCPCAVRSVSLFLTCFLSFLPILWPYVHCDGSIPSRTLRTTPVACTDAQFSPSPPHLSRIPPISLVLPLFRHQR